VNVDDPASPGAGEVLIRHGDLSMVCGHFPGGVPPGGSPPGFKGVGFVEAVGESGMPPAAQDTVQVKGGADQGKVRERLGEIT
jgi:NADPH:quinone reductase-like Zn-dependent oxidoreductase